MKLKTKKTQWPDADKPSDEYDVEYMDWLSKITQPDMPWAETEKEYNKRIRDIRFNYLGQFNKEISNDLFSLSFEKTGSEISAENRLTADLEVNCLAANGILNIDFKYSNDKFNQQDFTNIKESFMSNLNDIISHLKNMNDMYFTPSDFESTNIDEADLQELFDN